MSNRTDLRVISPAPGDLRMRLKASKTKITCRCTTNETHVWDAYLNNLTCYGKGCPICVNKTERIIFDAAVKVFEGLVFQQGFEWCKNQRQLLYDFALLDLKILIENHGPQHEVEVATSTRRRVSRPSGTGINSRSTGRWRTVSV